MRDFGQGRRVAPGDDDVHAHLQGGAAPAATDPLTGLPGRPALLTALTALAALGAAPAGEAGQAGGVGAAAPWSVLLLDLDRFADLNHVLGPDTGDQVLLAVAEAVAGALPAGGQLFRVGGDAFAALIPVLPAYAESLGHRVLALVAGIDVPGLGQGTLVSACLGISAVPTTDAAPAEALHAAEAALRSARATGSGGLAVYDADLQAWHDRRLELERRLRTAVADGAIDVAFEPIVLVPENRLIGVEALARWTDAVLGVVSPSEFIPCAERLGLLGDLGLHVLDRALDEVARLDLVGHGVRIGWNVSTSQLRRPGFPATVRTALAGRGLPPEMLILEFTEQTPVDAAARRALDRLAGMGCVPVIDDFGTGYSALDYLPKLRARGIKVDRALTYQLLTDGRARTVVRSLLDVARELGVAVVVEGVHSPALLAVVQQLGANLVQGDAVGSASDLEELLRPDRFTLGRRADLRALVPERGSGKDGRAVG